MCCVRLSDSYEDDNNDTDLGPDYHIPSDRTVRVQHVRLASKNGEGEVLGALRRDRETLDRSNSRGGTLDQNSTSFSSAHTDRNSNKNGNRNGNRNGNGSSHSSGRNSVGAERNGRSHWNEGSGSGSGRRELRGYANASSNLDNQIDNQNDNPMDNETDYSFDQLEGGISSDSHDPFLPQGKSTKLKLWSVR